MDMNKRGEATARGPSLAGPVLFGAGVGMLLLFLMVLVAAGLIWGGILPGATPSLLLSVCAGVCAFIGGRVAVGRSGRSAMVTAAVTAGILCAIFVAVCLGGTGGIAFPGQWAATVLLLLAGGCLAGMWGKKKKKKRTAGKGRK